MNDEIGQEILSELRKLNRMNRIAIAVTILMLVILGVYFVAIRPTLLRQRSAKSMQVTETRSWDDVRDALNKFDYSKAEKLIKEFIARQPTDSYGYAYLGNIYLTIGDVTNAEAQYAKACELLPDEQNERMLAAIRKRLARQGSASPVRIP